MRIIVLLRVRYKLYQITDYTRINIIAMRFVGSKVATGSVFLNIRLVISTMSETVLLFEPEDVRDEFQKNDCAQLECKVKMQ